MIICILTLLLNSGLGVGHAEQGGSPNGEDQFIVIDREKSLVSIKGWITSLKDSNHCGIGWSGGSHGSESGSSEFLFETKVKPEEVHEALRAIGKKPGNNLSWWRRSTPVEGEPISIKVSWPGSGGWYDLSELVRDDKGASLEFRFGGNLKAANKRKTGCIACFTSCYVGITSNSTLLFSERKNHRFRFTNLAPSPGTEVELLIQ